MLLDDIGSVQQHKTPGAGNSQEDTQLLDKPDQVLSNPLVQFEDIGNVQLESNKETNKIASSESICNQTENITQGQNLTSEEPNLIAPVSAGSEAEVKENSVRLLWVCLICGARRSRLQNTRAHIRAKHFTGHGQDTANEELAQHIKMMSAAADGPNLPVDTSRKSKLNKDEFRSTWVCLVCGEKRTRRLNALSHVKRDHSEVKDVKLEEAVKKVVEKVPEALKTNAFLKDGRFANYMLNLEKKYGNAHISNKECPVCNTDYKNKHNKLRHIKRTHYLGKDKTSILLKDKKFAKYISELEKKCGDTPMSSKECLVCSIKFRSNHHKLRHIKRTHYLGKDTTAFNHVQDKEFAKFLRQVYGANPGKRSNVCPLCGKESSSAHHMSRHLRLKHFGKEE